MSDSGPGQREIAYRLFATEFDDADFSYSESDEERAPNYVVTPTGGRVNRLFAVGVLTEVDRVSDDVLRGRVVDQTGPFVVYAGQYQPDAQTFLERTDPPAFVAVAGKARTFEPDDGDRVYTSVRPESLSEVDADTRDRYTVGAAEMTLHRVGVMADALGRDARGDDLRETLTGEDVDEGLAAGVALAIEHYGTTGAYLDAMRRTARQAVEVVAGERDEVDVPPVAPDADGPADLDALASLRDVSPGERGGSATEDASEGTTEATADAVSETARGESTTETEQTVSTAATDRTDDTPTRSADDASTATTDEMRSGTADESPASTGSSGGETTAEGTTLGEPAGGSTTEATGVGSGEVTDPGEFEPGEFDLDPEEREEIESEFGTEFRSGTDVEDPGEAGIEPETPPEETTAPTDGAETGTEVGEVETGGVETGEPADSTLPSEGDGDGADGEPDAMESAADAGGLPEEMSLEDAVVETMRDLDDGGGAETDAVVESVVETYGVAAADVEDAIQEALMDGLCYEPQDGVLKAI